MAQVPSPKSFFGHDVCEDYWLANYKQLSDYWKRLEQTSDRLKLVSMGKTEEGREQYMCVISSPENLKRLDKYKELSKKIAMGRDFRDEDTAKIAIREGKSIVWIDGGLHANEVLGAQQLIETAYQLTNRNDEENKRILNDCIVLLVHANPDGMDLVSDWYMRKSNPAERSLAGVPRLYEKYAGHDNNRDFYMNNTKESQNMSRVLYKEWHPHILYNHHQTAPGGTIMFIPPFRNPFNYHVDPIVQIGTDVVGMHMHQRLIGEGKGGTVMREGAGYSTWWNGGLRTTTYFHNMVGILTETYGSPNPGNVPFSNRFQVPNIDFPKPVDAGPWKLTQSLAYEVSANYAILDYASRYREHLMLNVFRAARNSVEKGGKDSWTRYPSRILQSGANSLKSPEFRDARAYVLSAQQADFETAKLFADKLMLSGCEVHVLEREENFGGKTYPKGSIVVFMNQAFRPFVMDMFEKQDYPNDFRYEGGPPNPPYDSAGYTLAYQMGVDFDRILETPTFTSAKLATGPLSGAINLFSNGSERAFLLSANENSSYGMVNVLLQKGYKVFRVPTEFQASGTQWPAGSFYVEFEAAKSRELAGSGIGGNVVFTTSTKPEGAKEIKKVRIGLVDRYGGSMPSGWTRYTLEQFKFPYEVIFPADIDKGDLRKRFDVILVPSGFNYSNTDTRNPLLDDETIPKEWRDRMGNLSRQKSLPALTEFEKAGGHLVLFGTSSQLADGLVSYQEGLQETNAEGRRRRLPNTVFYIPGSILRIAVKPDTPLTYGVGNSLDIMFDDSPAFDMEKVENPPAIVGWYDSEAPLRSGWAWGQERLKGLQAILDFAPTGRNVVLLGPELNFRSQPHASFKVWFNAIFRAGM